MPTDPAVPAEVACAHSRGCPLCGRAGAVPAGRDARREFRLCGNCDLVFAPAEYHLTPEREKARYDLHRNHPGDAGYRAFLGRLVRRLAPRLPAGARGLDFGSGPGPVLCVLLGELGFDVKPYDLYYADDRSLLGTRYDFVTCTETVEHFRSPRESWDVLAGLVRPGGYLGVMTRLRPPECEMARWDYANDLTHVCFYSPASFAWLAAHHGMDVELIEDDVVILRRPEASPAA